LVFSSVINLLFKPNTNLSFPLLVGE
jgi:hypothetical protein